MPSGKHFKSSWLASQKSAHRSRLQASLVHPSSLPLQVRNSLPNRRCRSSQDMETVKFSNTQYQKYPKLLFLLFDNLKCLVSTKHPRLGQATGFLLQKLCKGRKICWTFQLLLDLHLVHLAESVKMAISAIPPSLRSSKLWKFNS